jgi:hypothetical protein
MHCISLPETNRFTLFRDFCCLNPELGRNAGFYRGADKSLARPGTKQATSMTKSSWMDPTRSREVASLFVVCLNGRPRQATDVLQPADLLYRPLWTFQLWPPDASAPTDAFRTLAAEVGTYGRRIRTGKFCVNAEFHGTFRDLLHAANLRHGNHGFTSLPKEGVLRIFMPLKIRRLRPGLNPRTWVPAAITLTPRPPKPLRWPVAQLLI